MKEKVPVIKFEVSPRQVWDWSTFQKVAPECSIALDGMVTGGPQWDEELRIVNFDHHDGVVREATMSTAMQVLFAIKGGMMDRFGGKASVFINDCDQDTVFACWLLLHYKMFTGAQSHPIVNRLLALSDKWDITGGAYPMSLDDSLVKTHCWVFQPYTDLRKNGHVATADVSTMTSCLEACMARLDAALLGKAQEKELDTRHEILHVSPKFKIVRETGGNEARYYLFSAGLLDGYVSIVATRPDGRTVYTIGRRSRYIHFPVQQLYQALSAAEPPVGQETPKWNGSDLIGGSDRRMGSGLSWEQVRDVIESHLTKAVS